MVRFLGILILWLGIALSVCFRVPVPLPKDQRIPRELQPKAVPIKDDADHLKEPLLTEVKIPEGKQSVVIEGIPLQAFILPGMTVDVIVSIVKRDERQDRVITDVLVLGVDTNVIRNSRKGGVAYTFTIAVKKDDVGKLTIPAGEDGYLTLQPTSQEDEKPATMAGVAGCTRLSDLKMPVKDPE